jgi:serine/threonine-protein kinase
MGAVYRAYDPRLKRSVALKLLASELAEDERFREPFLRESELAASLEHPNVVPIHDVGEVDGQLFIVMRLVEGGDLKALLREAGRLEPERTLTIVSQVANALDAAHARGLVHRDVKPSNVLLDEGEHVYLTDFGLTKRVTETGAFAGELRSLGTVDYVAPEQIRGEALDGRTDVYSLGCLLYECLVGQPPFVRGSEAAVLFAHLEEDPPTLPALQDVTATALAKEPEDRFQTCRELVEAARNALGIAEPRRPRWPFAVAGVGAVLLGAALLAFALGRGSAVRVPPIEGNAVAAIDPGSGRVTEQILVGAGPEGIAYGSRSLWVANIDDGTVQRIDPASGRVVRTSSLGDTPTSLATTRDAVWVVGSRPNRFSFTVTRIDPHFFPLGTKQTGIPSVVAGSDGSVGTHRNEVWVAPSFGLLSRLDPRTGRFVQKIDPNAGPSSLAVADDAVWITDSDRNTVTRLDSSGRGLKTIDVGHGPSAIAVGAGAVWVADSLDDAVVRIDPRTRRPTDKIPVGRAPVGIAVGAGSVWVANAQDGTVMRINPNTHAVKSIDVGGSPQQIVVAAGRVWVTVQPGTASGPAPRSGGIARLSSLDGDRTLDPAFYPFDDPQLSYATCAALLNYPDKPAPAGFRLVPEVAKSMPTLSSDGRTYTFTIRKGFRFDPRSNEPVTAQNFKQALERALSPKTRNIEAPYHLGDIVGAQAYMARKAAHIAGVVARGNRLVIRLLAPAPDFLARLAPYSCAVPLGTPTDPKGVPLVPSAGPYFVASFTPEQGVVLERNPNYTGSRPHRLARIELTWGVSKQRSVAEIESGAVDYAPGAVPPKDAARLAALYGPGSTAAKRGEQRYFLHPVGQVDFYLLNTDRPLFRDVRMRRAVNYAIDRRALARIGRSWITSAVPADQYLPPGQPGFRDASIYPATPNLAAARRLEGGKRKTAVLYTCDDPFCERQAQIVKKDLKAIDIGVEIKAFPQPALYSELVRHLGQHAAKGAGYDLALAAWGLEDPDPENGLNVPLERVYLPAFDDPAYRRKLAAAARLSGPRRYLAYERLDADLARNAAPWVAYASELSADFFSARMGCQVYTPFYGIDLAALCIKKSRSR